jgi:protein TonB
LNELLHLSAADFRRVELHVRQNGLDGAGEHVVGRLEHLELAHVGTAGGFAKGVAGGTPQAPVNENQTYFEFQVEKQVSSVPGNVAPRYPDMLRSANVEGEVLAQFVVDTTGRADMSTFKVLKTTHDLFTNAVKSALPNMKFYPAEVGGKKVKQLVQMPFQFNLTKSE